MKRLKTAELSNLSNDDLVKRLNDLRTELSSLRSKAKRGTLKKELGEIKTVRRNIARVKTRMSLQRIQEEKSEKTVKGKPEKKEQGEEAA
jgi:ribosomal protein L29